MIRTIWALSLMAAFGLLNLLEALKILYIRLALTTMVAYTSVQLIWKPAYAVLHMIVLG